MGDKELTIDIVIDALYAYFYDLECVKRNCELLKIFGWRGYECYELLEANRSVHKKQKQKRSS